MVVHIQSIEIHIPIDQVCTSVNKLLASLSYELKYKKFLQIICLCILSIKLIHEAIYVYWVTDHMLPHEALHVYC